MTWETLLRPPLREIGAYRPGESLDELMARHGLDRVDKLNWNEGLWGPLPGVLDAVAAALDQSWAYPEHAYNTLRDAIGAETGAPPEQVLPGHGIQALILTLVNAFVSPGDAVVVPAPTYGLYAQSSASSRRTCGSTSRPLPPRCARAARSSRGSATRTTPPACTSRRPSGARSSTRSGPTAS